MLREYRLTNFKAFGETVTIPIRPLTLIFGANSSGKSSIFQSLLLLKQTLEEAKNPNTALLPKGSLVDLGTYSDFVHRHETDRDFEFGARFDLGNTNESISVQEGKRQEYVPSLPGGRQILDAVGIADTSLALRFSYDEENRILEPAGVDLTIEDERHPLISYADNEVSFNFESKFWRPWWSYMKRYIREMIGWAHSIEDGETEEDIGGDWEGLQSTLDRYQLEDIIGDVKKFVEMRQSLSKEAAEQKLELARQKLIGSIGFQKFFPDKFKFDLMSFTNPVNWKINISLIAQYYINDRTEYDETSDVSHRDIREELNESIHRTAAAICSPLPHILENLVHLGPVRSQPERYYEFSGDTTDYVGQSGEYLPSILFEDQELVEQANSDLERLGVKYRLKLDKLQYEDVSPSNIFSLRLVHTDTGIDASLRDVGFGISQVLPIVVQSRLSEKKTLLIEQPEIHLHPAHQAELGDMFIRSAKERGNTLLLETHSEHLILRILRRIRQTTNKDSDIPEGCKIRPEDVAVLYVQPGESGAQVIEIPVTEDGDFAEKWPRGFFTERAKELF